MLASSLVPCVTILLIRLWGAHTSSPTPACPTPCLCQKSPLLNCSSSGLSKAPSKIPATATSLDLSHNAIQSLLPLGMARLWGLQEFWVGDNALESLTMCLGNGVEGNKSLKRRKSRCVSWAPDLQVLSAARNQLKQIPRGLSNSKSLEVLQLSHNRISGLGPADLAGCTHLKEIHLQHNFINTIHPQAFKELPNLQILDVSYNLLTIVPLPAYLSLRNLNTLVDISGNRWWCDCNFKTIRRWLKFDNEVGNPVWKVMCSSPIQHAGKDLLYVEESDLICPSPVYSKSGLEKEVTVDEGTELLLSCANVTQDIPSRWWTPHGQVTENQQFLLVSNLTEQHAGLYVCISGFQEEHVSVFHLNVRKRVHNTRLRREAQKVVDELTGEGNLNMERNMRAVKTVPHSDFVLAICLSVFITFLVAFVLGVLLRPFLDKLCKKIRTKRDSTSSHTDSHTSSPQPRPYINEGFSDTDEHVQEVRVGSRVRFGGVTEVKDNRGTLPYYVTVEDVKSDSSSEDNTAVKGKESMTNNVRAHCVEMEDLKSREGSNLSSSLQVIREVPLQKARTKTPAPQPICGSSKVETTQVMEVEPIPDKEDITGLEEMSISPVSSHSELPQEQHFTFESVEQSVDSPIIIIHEEKEGNIDHEATMPGFKIDPLSNLKEECVDDLDPDLWDDSGESFSFPDESPRSSSRVTQVAVLDYPLFEKEMSVDNPSSCNSSESGLTEGEQTDYTVNHEEESEIFNDPHPQNGNIIENRLSTLDQNALTDEQSTGARFRQDTITLDPSDVHMTFTRGESLEDELFTDQNEDSDTSDIAYTVEEEPKKYHVHPVYRTSQKTSTDLETDSSGGNCSSEEEEEAGNACYPKRTEIKLDPEVKNELVIPVANPICAPNINSDHSSSSTDLEEKTNKGETPSSEEDLRPISKGDFFFGDVGASLDILPKVKRCIQFTQSEPQHSAHSPLTSLPVLETETGTMISGDSSDDAHSPASKGDHFFAKIDSSLDEIPKVKRYIQFTYSGPQSSAKPRSTSLNTESFKPVLGTKTESVTFDSSPEHELSQTHKGDRFFEEIGASVDVVPKVKTYIQFTKSEPQKSALLPSTSLKTEESVQMLGTTAQSMKSDSPAEDELSSKSKGDHFFAQTDTSVDVMPKVKRYIQFEPLESSQSPSVILKTEKVIPVLGTETESMKSDYSSKHELSPTVKGDNFFSEIGTYVDAIPKVKRYIQFTEFKPQPSVLLQTAFIKPKKVIPVSETECQFVRPEVEHSAPTKEDSFFKEIGTSLDVVPKVKTYIQFTQLEPQLSCLHPSPILTERFIPVLGSKSLSLRSLSSSEDQQSPVSKEDNFFGQISASVNKVPKVKRHIQFTPCESHFLAQSTSTSLKKKSYIPVMGTKKESVRSESSECSPISKGDSFFGEIGSSLDVVPKVKRYIQFTKSEPQDSALLPSTFLKSESVKPVLGTRPESVRSDSSSQGQVCLYSKGNSFFEEIGTSIDGVPKVKRYIHFTQSEPKKHSGKSDTTFGDEQSPTTTEKKIYEQIDTSPSVSFPKIQRYIQFTQSEPQHCAQSLTSLNEEKILPTLVTNIQSTRPGHLSEDKLIPNKEDNFFEQVGTTYQGVPRVKRYIQFTHSEPQPSDHSTSTSWVSPKLETEVQSIIAENELSPPTKGEALFVQISPSLNGIPKVKRYIQFTSPGPQVSSQLPSSIKAKRDTNTQSLRSHLSSVKELSPPTKEETVFGYRGTSLDGVPKVKRYLEFTQSGPAQSPLTSLNEENIIPILVAKTQSHRSDPPSEDKPSPTSKEEHLFGHTSTSFVGIPKVERYIQFTQSEPQPSDHSTSMSWVRPKLETEVQSIIAENELSPPTKGEALFVQISPSLNGIPKVKRYIQFTSPGPQVSIQLPSSIKAKRDTNAQSLRSNLSSEKELSPTTKEETVFGCIGTSLGGVPKVKRYLQFTQSGPAQSPSTSLNEERAIPTLVTKTQSEKFDPPFEDKFSPTSVEENLFRQIELPKVKRYIKFTQSELLSKEPMIHGGKDVEKDKQGFFRQIGACFYGIPKVKGYIQFTPSAFEHSVWPSALYGARELTTPELLTNTELQRSDDVKPINKADVFGYLDIPLYKIPKVKRYIQFTKCKFPQSGSSSDNEAMLINQKDNFFEGIYLSHDNIPKVKRSLQFTQSELGNQICYPSLSKGRLTAELETKKESFGFSYSPEAVRPNIQYNVFEVPKVKRYIQFSQTEVYSSNHSSSLNNEKVVLTESKGFEAKSGINPDITGDNFFETVAAQVNGLPKLKRYIKFTHPYMPVQSSTLSQDRVPRSGSQDTFGTTSMGELPIFLQIGTTFNGLPKIKRYIQFTESGPQSPSPHNPSYRTDAQVAESKPSDLAFKKENAGVNFFRQINASLDQLPKVKRYVHFTQSDPHLSSSLPSTHAFTTRVDRRHSFTYGDELKCSTKEDNFFGQIGASLCLDEVPKVSRYIQFGQSKPHTQAPVSYQSDGRAESEDSDESVSVDIKDIFGQIEVSCDTLQRPKRSLVFTTSTQQDQNQIQALSSIKNSSLGMNVAIGTSTLEQLSRPKSTLFCSNSDPYRQSDQAFSSLQTGLCITEPGTTLGPMLSTLGSENSDFSLDKMQRPTRSLRFSTLERHSETTADLDQVPKSLLSPATETPPQYEQQPIKETTPISSGKDNAREYLRNSSEARQRQERRRLLFQEKKRAMNEFGLTSSTLQDRDKQESLSDHYEEKTPIYSGHTFHSVSTRPVITKRHMNVNISGSEGLISSRISSLKYKSAMQHGTYKYHSDV